MLLNMSKTISEKIDPNRMPRQPFGLKAETTLQRATFTPSSANPGETLYVNIPKLSGNNVIVPNSVRLAFDLELQNAEANDTVVNNLGRNLVNNFKVLLGGEVLQDTKRHDLFYTYHDSFLPKTERTKRLRQGISSENMRKLRTGAGDASTSDAGQVSLGKIYGKRYHIPINHPILDDHGVFYPRSLRETLSFEIRLAPVFDVIITSDSSKGQTYQLKNMELEYTTISSEYLAQEAAGAYNSGKGFFYENIFLHKVFEISKPDDSVLNEHINVPRRSMSGILCLFNDTITEGARDSESFINPAMLTVAININGMPNKLYSKSMQTTDFYESMLKRMEPLGGDMIYPSNFYTGGRFGLWIDLRSFPDPEIHGGGFALDSTSDGVKLEIRRKAGGSGKITCYVYIVSDAIAEVMNGGLNSIKY